MADPAAPIDPAATAAPVVAEAISPTAEAAATSAPPIPADAAPAAAVSSPVAAAPLEPAALESAHDKPTLLEEHDAKAAEAKPAEAKPEDARPVEAKAAEAPKADAKTEAPKPDAKAAEAKPADAKPEPAAPAAPEPVEYKYTVPETLKMDDALKGDLRTALDEFRTNPAEGAQKLVDLHAGAMQRYADTLLGEQHRVFNETRKGWRTEVMADVEIGGAGHQTAMGAIARARDALVSSAKGDTPKAQAQQQADMKAFSDMLRTTGVGDHPAFLKLLHNAAQYVDEPRFAPPDARSGPKLQQQNARPPGSFKEVMYDHARSKANDS